MDTTLPLTPRDRWLPQHHWNNYLPGRERELERLEAILSRSDLPPADRYRLQAARFSNRLRLLIARYSAGCDIATIRALYPVIIHDLVAYLDIQGTPLNFRLFDDYTEALWLVALAVLSGRLSESSLRYTKLRISR